MENSNNAPISVSEQAARMSAHKTALRQMFQGLQPGQQIDLFFRGDLESKSGTYALHELRKGPGRGGSLLLILSSPNGILTIGSKDSDKIERATANGMTIDRPVDLPIEKRKPGRPKSNPPAITQTANPENGEAPATTRKSTRKVPRKPSMKVANQAAVSTAPITAEDLGLVDDVPEEFTGLLSPDVLVIELDDESEPFVLETAHVSEDFAI